MLRMSKQEEVKYTVHHKITQPSSNPPDLTENYSGLLPLIVCSSCYYFSPFSVYSALRSDGILEVLKIVLFFKKKMDFQKKALVLR